MEWLSNNFLFVGEVVHFEELLLKSARNGDYKTVSEIIKAFQEGKATLDINCKGVVKLKFWVEILKY